MQHYGMVPDVITHSAANSACEKGQRCQQALRLLRTMQLLGIVPEVITHRAVSSACKKDQEHQQALILLRTMQRHYVVPDVITHSTVISAGEKDLNQHRPRRHYGGERSGSDHGHGGHATGPQTRVRWAVCLEAAGLAALRRCAGRARRHRSGTLGWAG